MGTEEKRGTTFRSSTDEVLEKPTWNNKTRQRKECIREKTGTQNIVKEIKQYQKKWLQHIQRMDTNRLPKQVLQYKPKGRRKVGRPRKRWRDKLHLEDQETGNSLNLHEHDDDDDEFF